MVKKFAFNSTLKRMSTLCQVSESTGNSTMVLSKGAPEVLVKYMKDVPADYQAEMLAFTREQAEIDLKFAGFIVAECPVKADSLAVI